MTLTREPTKWRKIPGVLIVALIATAFLVMTWGTVSAGEAEGTGLPDGWLLFLAGDPDASHSSVVSSLDTLRADGYSTSTLTGQVQDSLNAAVEGAFVCFTTTLGTINSGMGYVEAESTSVVTEPVSLIGQDACGNDLTDGTVVTLTTGLGSFSGGTRVTTTASSGQACDILLSTNTVGTATITGTVDSLTGTTTVDFVAGPAYVLVVEPVVITTTCGITQVISGHTTTHNPYVNHDAEHNERIRL